MGTAAFGDVAAAMSPGNPVLVFVQNRHLFDRLVSEDDCDAIDDAGCHPGC